MCKSKRNLIDILFRLGPYEPKKCGPNEYFEVCSYRCPSEDCPTSPEKPCDPGDGCCVNKCRCKEGYSRNSEGCCIPTNECDKDSGIYLKSLFTLCTCKFLQEHKVNEDL